MIDNIIEKLILKKADIWLKQNPLMLNSAEKQKFLLSLKTYLNCKSNTVDDEVYDFLVQTKLINQEPREKVFTKFLTEKYSNLSNSKVLDVGAGRICCLSKELAELGCKVSAMDANIRLTTNHLKQIKIEAIKKPFYCDEYSLNNNGTNIEKYNLIVGLEPCDATEHIIRQCLKYNKAFDVFLCAVPHNALNGKVFKTAQEWYNYLTSISSDVSIVKQKVGFIATNNSKTIKL